MALLTITCNYGLLKHFSCLHKHSTASTASWYVSISLPMAWNSQREWFLSSWHHLKEVDITCPSDSHMLMSSVQARAPSIIQQPFSAAMPNSDPNFTNKTFQSCIRVTTPQLEPTNDYTIYLSHYITVRSRKSHTRLFQHMSFMAQDCLQNGWVVCLVCWWAWGCSSSLTFSLHRWLAKLITAQQKRKTVHQSLSLPVHSLSTAIPMHWLLMAAGVTWDCKAPTMILLRWHCAAQWRNRQIKKRKVPVAVKMDEVNFLHANVHTQTRPGKRVLLDDEVAGQICLPASNTNRRQQLKGWEDSLRHQQGAQDAEWPSLASATLTGHLSRRTTLNTNQVATGAFTRPTCK